MGDISSIVQLMAMGGFLVGFAGVALIVAAASQGRNVRGGVLLAAIGLVGGFILLIISQGILVVEPTRRAVVFNVLSGELEQPRGSGVNIIIPGVQIPYLYPISQQSYTMSDSTQEGDPNRADAITARSIDGQEVVLDLTVIFRLVDDREALNNIHQDWSTEVGGYRENLVRPVIRSVVRDVVAGFEAESIYGAGREDVQAQISTRLAERFAEDGIELSDVRVRDISFSADFIQAIEAKQVEEQRLQRAITEAERREREAEGRANATVAEADGEARAILIRAQAEAEALRLISQQIAANPNLIQYTYVQNLSDNVGIALVPSSSPFLFNFSDFTQLEEGFLAPDVPEANADALGNFSDVDTDNAADAARNNDDN